MKSESNFAPERLIAEIDQWLDPGLTRMPFLRDLLTRCRAALSNASHCHQKGESACGPIEATAVPREPTEAMIKAAVEAQRTVRGYWRETWIAMYDAALQSKGGM